MRPWMILSMSALVACEAAEPEDDVDVPPPGPAWADYAGDGAVQRVEAERYLGRWYEIASVPLPFQRGCRDTTATYVDRGDATIAVINRCVQGDGTVWELEGSARAVDDSFARLKVSFFGAGEADYWVVELDEAADGAYRTAAVSDPSQLSLWILHREPELDAEVEAELLERLDERGYRPERMEPTEQGFADDPS